MKKRSFWGLLPFVLFFSGCKDAAEPIPAYVEIKPFTVNAEGGAGWQKITEAYLYVNREYLGAYTLPASVPVLAEGESLIYAYPGVKENGRLATPNIYPFLLRHEQTLSLTGGQTTVLQPVTAYDTDAKYPWTLDRTTFDGVSSVVFENRDGDDQTTYVLSTDSAYAGKSLLMEVNTAHPTILIASETVVLPTDNNQVWVEMHYRNDLNFEVYLAGKSSGTNEVIQGPFFINTRTAWNKIYLNLTSLLVDSQQETYRLLFKVTLPTDNAGNYTQTTGSVRLDNLRLVHY